MISYSLGSGRWGHGKLIRTDFSGDTLWTSWTEGDGHFICQTINGHYLTGGQWLSNHGVGGTIELFDGNGNQIWVVDLGSTFPCSAIQSSDSSFVLTGYHDYPPPTGISITKLEKIGSITGLKKSSDNITESFSLSQNFPNPFNPRTTIEFDLPKTGEVSLKIFNILGEEVATLVSDRLSTGSYSYEWNASSLASGVYIYRLIAGDLIENKKMVLMK